MIDENEAFKAGLVIAIIMLASGFSMLFTPTYTGDGAVVLSLGVMTMVLVLMLKVLVVQIQRWMDYNARIEETVSEILSFRHLYSLEPASPKKQTKPRKKQSLEEIA
jgi:uncharacterized membrane protein